MHSPMPRSSVSHPLALSLLSLSGYARSGMPRARTLSTWLAFTPHVRSARGSERTEERTGTAYLTPRKNPALGTPASATYPCATPASRRSARRIRRVCLRMLRKPAGEAGCKKTGHVSDMRQIILILFLFVFGYVYINVYTKSFVYAFKIYIAYMRNKGYMHTNFT